MASISRKKKNITLDDLAGMVQHGFLGVDKRFDIMEAEINARFDQIENLI